MLDFSGLNRTVLKSILNIHTFRKFLGSISKDVTIFQYLKLKKCFLSLFPNLVLLICKSFIYRKKLHLLCNTLKKIKFFRWFHFSCTKLSRNGSSFRVRIGRQHPILTRKMEPTDHFWTCRKTLKYRALFTEDGSTFRATIVSPGMSPGFLENGANLEPKTGWDSGDTLWFQFPCTKCSRFACVGFKIFFIKEFLSIVS